MHHVQLRKVLLAPSSSARESWRWRRRGSTGPGGWVCFLLFYKLNSVKHRGADGFAVITQTKEKLSYCFKQKTIDQV